MVNGTREILQENGRHIFSNSGSLRLRTRTGADSRIELVFAPVYPAMQHEKTRVTRLGPALSSLERLTRR